MKTTFQNKTKSKYNREKTSDAASNLNSFVQRDEASFTAAISGLSNTLNTEFSSNLFSNELNSFSLLKSPEEKSPFDFLQNEKAEVLNKALENRVAVYFIL